MDTAIGLFAGQDIVRNQIVSLGIEDRYDPKTGWDWVVFCRTYANQTLYEPQPTLRDAMLRLHQLTKPIE